MQVLLVRHGDGNLGLRLLGTQVAPGELQSGLAARGEKPYAFCSSPPSSTGEPFAADLDRWRGTLPLFLTVTLGTKGVLQLQGWRSEGAHLRALELKLHD